MGLLLSEIAHYQPLIPVVEAHDLARVLSLVLQSPLVQNRKARQRLLEAGSALLRPVSDSVQSSSSISSLSVNSNRLGSGKGISKSLEQDTTILFGLPQVAWPTGTGWLDGIFALALSCSEHPQLWTSLLQLSFENRTWPRIWTAVAQVLDIADQAKPAVETYLDWCMLSPKGLCSALKFAFELAVKEPKLLLESLHEEPSEVLSCLNYLLTMASIQNNIDSFSGLSLLGALILNLPFSIQPASLDGQEDLIRIYANSKVISGLGNLSVFLHKLDDDGHITVFKILFDMCSHFNSVLTSLSDWPYIFCMDVFPCSRWVIQYRKRRSRSLEETCLRHVILLLANFDTAGSDSQAEFLLNETTFDIIVRGLKSDDLNLRSSVYSFLVHFIIKSITKVPRRSSSISQHSSPSVDICRCLKSVCTRLLYRILQLNNDASCKDCVFPNLQTIQSLSTLHHQDSSVDVNFLAFLFVSLVFLDSSVTTQQPPGSKYPKRKSSCISTGDSGLLETLDRLTAFVFDELDFLKTNYLTHSNPLIRFYTINLLNTVLRPSATSSDTILACTTQVMHLLKRDSSNFVKSASSGFLRSVALRSLKNKTDVEPIAILECLLDVGCSDVALDVQEAAFASLRAVLDSDEPTKKSYLRENVCNRLINQRNKISKLAYPQSFFGRMLGNSVKSPRPQSSAAGSTRENAYEPLLRHLDALCEN